MRACYDLRRLPPAGMREEYDTPALGYDLLRWPLQRSGPTHSSSQVPCRADETGPVAAGNRVHSSSPRAASRPGRHRLRARLGPSSISRTPGGKSSIWMPQGQPAGTRREAISCIAAASSWNQSHTEAQPPASTPDDLRGSHRFRCNGGSRDPARSRRHHTRSGLRTVMLFCGGEQRRSHLASPGSADAGERRRLRAVWCSSATAAM